MATILPQTLFEAWVEEGWTTPSPPGILGFMNLKPNTRLDNVLDSTVSYSGKPTTSGWATIGGNSYGEGGERLFGYFRRVAYYRFINAHDTLQNQWKTIINLWIFQQNGKFRCVLKGETTEVVGSTRSGWSEKEVTAPVSTDGVMTYDYLNVYLHYRVTVTFGSVTFRTVGGGASVAYFIDGIQKAFFTVPKDSQVSRRWTGFRNLRIEISGFKGGGFAGAKVYRNGALVAASIGTSISLSTFGDKDVIEIRVLTVKEAYPPLFAGINANLPLPLFADINKKTHLPLFAGWVGYTISYAFLNRSHLWTRISTHYSNTSNALSDDYFPGRSSNYDGSSGDSGKNIRVSLSKLYANSSAISNPNGTKSITLYFFCALCNWGCTSDYESGDVDFSVLWKTFTVANIPRATSDDPGPGNEPFAFSFTITIRKNGNRYLATAVSITDKDGNTY